MPQPEQQYGIRFCIPRKTLTKKDFRDLGFSSSLTTLKTFLSGIISKAAPSVTLTTIQVAHGLGYRPAFNGFFRDTLTGEVYAIASGFEDSQFGRVAAEINVHGKSDNYNLTFDIFNNAGVTKNVDIFFEVFYEDLTSEPQYISSL